MMEEKKKEIKSYNIDKITDKIYLGDIEGAYEIDYLKQEGITHLLSLLEEEFCPKYEDDYPIIRKIVDVDDEDSQNIFQFFKECIEFIENATKIYIHCMAGVSRSPTIVISYLMWKEKKGYNETYFFVKNKRRFIGPNEGFVSQLKLFEEKLKENNYNLGKIDFKNINIDELLKKNEN